MTPAAVLPAGTALAEATQLAMQSLRQAGVEQPEVDARLLIGHALGLDRAQLIAQDKRLLEAQERASIDALLARRRKREPVARIVGMKEFWSLPLAVTPDVLVPRPETETVVEAALAAIKDGNWAQKALRVLDIGTGSGALLLALISELPRATGIGTDISAAALGVAHANAARNGLAARCTFVACDIAAGVRGPFDLIVANPPYVARGEIATLAPEVRDYEPRLALDGGRDGLDGYRAIAASSQRLLESGGRLIVELGAGQEDAVRALFTKSALSVTGIRRDLSGTPRALTATGAS
jgi:release factor glutamine methyltransferase